MTVEWLTGSALETMRRMPSGSADLCATSPPFLGLRDYNGVDGQWGSEGNPAGFLANLLDLAVETRRVLAPHGSLAWELGDTYSTVSNGSAKGMTKAGWTSSKHRAGQRVPRNRGGSGGSEWPQVKSMCLLPTLFAASLAYGRNMLDPAQEFEPWLVRNVIVWARPNPAPGALADKFRPSTSYITVATPSPSRWFDLDAVRQPFSPNSHARTTKRAGSRPNTVKTSPDGNRDTLAIMNNDDGAGAPPLDYWDDEYDGDTAWLIAPLGSSLAHYAMWPAKLAERIVLSMCPAEVCTVCREPRRRIVHTANAIGKAVGRWGHGQAEFMRPGSAQMLNLNDKSVPKVSRRVTTGWTDCGHDNYRRGHVVDPFCGTGTTLAAADIHGRDATGIDIDPGNLALYKPRYVEVLSALTGRPAVDPAQLTIFGAE